MLVGYPAFVPTPVREEKPFWTSGTYLSMPLVNIPLHRAYTLSSKQIGHSVPFWSPNEPLSGVALEDVTQRCWVSNEDSVGGANLRMELDNCSVFGLPSCTESPSSISEEVNDVAWGAQDQKR